MKHIAVIEDNPDNRLLVEVILDGRFRLSMFDNGTDGLTAIKAEPPDLLVLDVSLPGIDGAQVLARIREDHLLRNLPVIALTAHAMAGDREKFLKLGFDDYVSKPIEDENVLLGSIERLLEKGPARSAE